MGEDTAVIETVDFSVDEVRRVLNEIKPVKSPGSDAIPGLILKEISVELAMPLSSLFELSMRTGSLSSLWKTAIIVPLVAFFPAATPWATVTTGWLNQVRVFGVVCASTPSMSDSRTSHLPPIIKSYGGGDSNPVGGPG
ncbi:unnamed protein product [Schistocephalus solidus]|uniref:Uncharacterized protein n=1 Tax=Schistocephalus solidus TaxID=70667 RepID=A0A183TPT7_SCHSO|nr:unnamed protein product [Schistocephalus solidus]